MPSPRRRSWNDSDDDSHQSTDESVTPLAHESASRSKKRFYEGEERRASSPAHRDSPGEENTSTFAMKELKKITVTIERNKKDSKNCQRLITAITDPDLIRPVRRKETDEGKCPIFDRPELLEIFKLRKETEENSVKDSKKKNTLPRNLSHDEEPDANEKNVKKRTHSTSPSSRVIRGGKPRDDFERSRSRHKESRGHSRSRSKQREGRSRSRSKQREGRSHSRSKQREGRSRSRSRSKQRENWRYRKEKGCSSGRSRERDHSLERKKYSTRDHNSSRRSRSRSYGTRESSYERELKRLKRIAREMKEKDDRILFLRKLEKEKRERERERKAKGEREMSKTKEKQVSKVDSAEVKKIVPMSGSGSDGEKWSSFKHARSEGPRWAGPRMPHMYNHMPMGMPYGPYPPPHPMFRPPHPPPFRPPYPPPRGYYPY